MTTPTQNALQDFDRRIDSLRYVLNFANSEPNKTLGSVINSTFHKLPDGRMITTYRELENLWESRETIRQSLQTLEALMPLVEEMAEAVVDMAATLSDNNITYPRGAPINKVLKKHTTAIATAANISNKIKEVLK